MGNAQATELLKTPIAKLVPEGQQLKYVDHEASVASALIELKESGVSHLPIRGGDGGTISFSDLVYFLVEKDFQKDAFLNANATEAMREHHSILVSPTSTLESVILRMLKYRPYRVCVTSSDDTQEIASVVSQSDIIAFLYKHREVLIPDREKKLIELAHLGNKGKVISVKETETVKEVCKMLNKRRVNAVAVTDENGIMTGAVLPTTFRSLSPSHWIDFDSPIGKYEIEGRDPGWVTAEETFESILEKLVKHHLHRVFVVTDAQHPGRVITLSDIMRHFIMSTEVGRTARAEHKKRRKEHKKK